MRETKEMYPSWGDDHGVSFQMQVRQYAEYKSIILRYNGFGSRNVNK